MELFMNIICGLIPLIYLIIFVIKENKKKKRNYLYGLIVAAIIFLILFVIRLLVLNFLPDKKEEEKTTTTTKTTTEVFNETNTTTSKSTKTTEVTKPASYNYNSILAPEGGEVIGKTPKGYEVRKVNGLYYVGGYLIANKTYNLPESYNPGGLNATVKKAADEMFAAGKEAVENNMWAQSGFRSYDTQKSIYNRYANKDGKAKADTYSARPGYSEHQTGLAFDVCATDKPCITNGFDNTKEAKWLAENAYKYGFILRYPSSDEKIKQTGYIYESWHFRYVGTDLSYKLYNNGDWITMEDYFGITSSYDDKPIGE